MVGLGVSSQTGVGEVKSLLFCAAWCELGRLRGARCAGLGCIYSSDSVHGANRKEYISLLLLKIPGIAKQDLAFFFFSVLCSKIQFELVKSGLHEADKSRGTPLKTGVSSGGGKETPSALASLNCFVS